VQAWLGGKSGDVSSDSAPDQAAQDLRQVAGSDG
jgi:hypothetical protein